jgi:hypothetical protein
MHQHQTHTPIKINMSVYIDPPYSMVQGSWDTPKKSTPKGIDGFELKRAIWGVFTEAVWNPTLPNTIKIDHKEIKMEPENYGEPLNILGEFSRMFMRMKPNTLQPVLVGNVWCEGYYDPETHQFCVLRAISVSETEEWKKIYL